MSNFFVYAQHNGAGFEFHYVLDIDLTTGQFTVLKNPNPSSAVQHKIFDDLFTKILGVKPSTLPQKHQAFLQTRVQPNISDAEINAHFENATPLRNPRTHFIFNKDRIHQLHITLGELKVIPIEWLAPTAKPVAAVPARSGCRQQGSEGSSESKANSTDPSATASPRAADGGASAAESSSEYESVRPSQDSSSMSSRTMSRVPSDLQRNPDCLAALGGGSSRRRLSTMSSEDHTDTVNAMERLEAEHEASEGRSATDPNSIIRI